MTTPDPDPQAVLREEILGDAKRQGDRLVHHARKEAESLLADAKTTAEKEHADADAHAREEAARRRATILATVAVEAGRARAARVEALLRTVHAAAAKRLAARDGFDYRATLVRLAGEAISRMEGDVFRVELSGEDRRAMGEGLVDDIARAAGREPLDITLTDGVDAGPGAVVIRDAAGRQVWDNGLLARLHRNWPLLRNAVAIHTRLIETGEGKGGDA